MKQEKENIIQANKKEEMQSPTTCDQTGKVSSKKFGIIKKQDVVNDITSANLLEKRSSLKRRYLIAASLVLLVVLAIIGTTFLILMALSKVQ